MFADARQIPSGTELAADLCIVGAGAAGITLAREFIGGDAKVVLLESGGLAFDPQLQDLYKGRNAGLPYWDLDFCQIRYFGGNTNGWGGWCRPMDDDDFETQSWVPYSGWPFPGRDLRLHYLRAKAICELPAAGYDAEEWRDRLGDRRAALLPVHPEVLETTIYQFSPPTRFGPTYRGEIGAASNVRCLLNATATKLETSWNAGEVRRIRAATLGGNSFFVKAKIFVLAAGGTENPRLLLMSRDVAANGLGNGHDLVGRFFMEHPHTQRRLIPSGRPAALALYGLAFRSRGVSARLSLPASLRQRERLLGYSANIHPVYLGHNSEGWLALRKLVLSMSSSRRTDPFIRFPPYGKRGATLRDVVAILRQLPTTTIGGFLQLLRPQSLIRSFILESKGEQSPNPESRLRLLPEVDALGLNRVSLDWNMLPLDRCSMIRGEEIVDGELRRLGIGQLEPLPPRLLKEWPDKLEGGWHQLGMTRMHVDPRHGVVDGDGRLHGTGNTFIVGGSVFPTGGVGPPTLTVVALALRLADHLRETVFRRHTTARAQPPSKALGSKQPV